MKSIFILILILNYLNLYFCLINKETTSKNNLVIEYHEHENRDHQFYRQQKLLIENCDFELTNQTGILHSPMFPEKLRTNRSLTCIWRIYNPNLNDELSAIELNIQVANLRTWSEYHFLILN